MATPRSTSTCVRTRVPSADPRALSIALHAYPCLQHMEALSDATKTEARAAKPDGDDRAVAAAGIHGPNRGGGGGLANHHVHAHPNRFKRHGRFIWPGRLKTRRLAGL